MMRAGRGRGEPAARREPRQPMHRRGAQMTSEASDATATDHVHHWILSEPSGGEVPGRCKGCGEVRGFPSNPSNPYLRGLAKKRPTRRDG